MHLKAIRSKIKNSDGVRRFPASSQSLSHRCSKERKRNPAVRYKTKRGNTTSLSNVEISLPIRNRRNSFFPSYSNRDDMSVVAPEVSSKPGMGKTYLMANILTFKQRKPKSMPAFRRLGPRNLIISKNIYIYIVTI